MTLTNILLLIIIVMLIIILVYIRAILINQLKLYEQYYNTSKLIVGFNDYIIKHIDVIKAMILHRNQ